MLQTAHFQVSLPSAFFERNGYSPVGMFSPSAKISTFRARPSGPKSEKMRTVSRPGDPTFTGKGYSRDSVIHSRPSASHCMFIGLRRSGSLATSWISKPGGRWNAARSCSGVSGSVERTSSAKGSFFSAAILRRVKTTSRGRMRRFMRAGSEDVITHGV